MLSLIKNYPPPYVKAKAAINDKYITDPLTVVVTEVISGWRWITPTAVTLTSFAVACVAWYLFLDGSRNCQLWGALVWEAGYMLDAVDGKLARKRQEFAPYGACLDAHLDKVKKLGALAALTIAMPAHWVGMTVLVLIHYGLNRINYRECPAVVAWTNRMKLRTTFDPLDQLFIILFLGPLLGRVYEALVLVVFLQLTDIALHTGINWRMRTASRDR